ncbi:baseplate J/gp47 family protein [Bdellovibrio bacteriovorus]|uniref:baseplate J/gp47 family protein n=1 Tax=Bdellovibrio bacteriovorus TaxID=959 RepID=UPI003AA91FFE
MAEIFLTPRQIVQQMCDDVREKTNGAIVLSPDDLNDEMVLKFWPVATAISSFRADLTRVDDNTFAQSADEAGLEKHLESRKLPERFQPQASTGVIRFTGVNGSAIPIGRQVKRKKDGRLYVTAANGEIAGGACDVVCQSLQVGNIQNLEELGQQFELVIPIPGVENDCVNQSKFLGGRDLESPGEMLARYLSDVRDDRSGGNIPSYEAWAREASPEVVSAKSIRHVRGLGTVDTVITAGTTNFEQALIDGHPIERMPPGALLEVVQAYILDMNPTTDQHLTIAPIEQDFSVAIYFDLYDESLRPQVVAIVERLAKVFIYQAKPSDVLNPTQLHRMIDGRVGHLIKSLRVGNLDGDSKYFAVPPNKILNPELITIGAF